MKACWPDCSSCPWRRCWNRWPWSSRTTSAGGGLGTLVPCRPNSSTADLGELGLSSRPPLKDTEVFFNRQRLLRALGYLNPTEYEEVVALRQAALSYVLIPPLARGKPRVVV